MPASRMARRTRLMSAVDVDAERRQHVGRARFRREIAVAVLGHRHAAAGDDERRRGRDVEGAGAVAAGADGVDGARRRLDRQRLGAHGARGAGDLLDRLAAHAQRHQERAHLRRRRVARHHRVEGGGGLGLARAARRRRRGASSALEIGDDVAHAGDALRARRARGSCCSSSWPPLRGDAFGMELHAVDRPLAMGEAHDQPVVGLGGDAQRRPAGSRARRSSE